MKKNTLAFLLGPLLVAPSLAIADAPFGLTWGMSKAEVESLGVTLLESSSEGSIAFYRTDELPIDLSNAEIYSLVIEEDRGLQKVTMVSDNIENDAYGDEGKRVYNRLKTALIDKYGEPDSDFEFVGGTLWDEDDEFYQCLAYDGCGGWASFFINESAGESVFISLEGLSRGTGYIKLAYEGPEWGAVVDEADAAKASQDASAL